MNRKRGTKKRQTAKAKKLAAAFHGKQTAKIFRVRFPSLPAAVVLIGTLDRLDYVSDKEGEDIVYEHPSTVGAKIYADPTGRQIIIVPPGKKRFKISARGLLN